MMNARELADWILEKVAAGELAPDAKIYLVADVPGRFITGSGYLSGQPYILSKQDGSLVLRSRSW